jgi:hypothetical protein
MEFTLNCKQDSSGNDRIEVERDYDEEIRFRLHGGSVFATDDAARTFAHQILALVGDEAESTAVKVGDLVEITKFRSDDQRHVGKRGAVEEVDSDEIPFYVRLSDGNGVWVMDVRKVTATASSSRSFLLAEARREAGTEATPADVLAYAKFLSE